MVTALNWHDVNAPSFQDAIAAYRLGAESLDRGLTVAKAGLKEFDQTKTDAVSARFMADLFTKYQGNAAKLQEDLMSGSALAGINPARLNPAALIALRDRAGQLQQHEAGDRAIDLTEKNIELTGANIDQTQVETSGMRDTNEFNQWTRGETKMDRNAAVAARPLLARFQAAIGDGSPEGEARGRALLAEPDAQLLIAQLPMADQIALRTAGSEQVAAILGNSMQRETIAHQPVLREGYRLNNEGQRIGNATNQRAFEWGGEDRANETAAAGAVQMALMAAPDADTARGILMGSGLNGRAFNIALGALEGRFPGLVGSIQPQPETGGETGAHTSIMNYQARAVGINSVPANVKTLGQASEFAKQVNRAGAPSSAMGTFQITGDTLRDFGPRVFGKNWQNQEFTPVAQDKLAEAIFNSSKGSAQALRNRWVSLSLGEAERIRKLPWAQARVVIAKGESGANLSAPPAARLAANRTQAQQIETGLRQAQNRTSSIATEWAAGAGDNRDISSVVDELRGSTFKGASREMLVRELKEVMQRTNGNAAQAAAILRRSVTDAGSGTAARLGRGLYNWTAGWVGENYNPTLPGGVRIGEDQVNALVREVRSGNVVGNTVEDARLTNVQELTTRAETQFRAADSRYQAALAALQRGDARQNTILPRLEQQRNAAYQQLLLLQGTAGREPYLRYQKPGSYGAGGIPGLVDVRGTR